VCKVVLLPTGHAASQALLRFSAAAVTNKAGLVPGLLGLTQGFNDLWKVTFVGPAKRFFDVDIHELNVQGARHDGFVFTSRYVYFSIYDIISTCYN
jgi:hypothetical protein